MENPFSFFSRVSSYGKRRRRRSLDEISSDLLVTQAFLVKDKFGDKKKQQKQNEVYENDEHQDLHVKK